MRAALVLIGASLTLATSNAQTTFTVDPTRSTIDLELCVNTLTTVCDAASTTASGTVVLDIEGGAMPTALTFLDFDVNADQSLAINVNLGFSGSVVANGDNLAVAYAGPVLGTGPFAVSPAGVFDAMNISVNSSGTADYTLNGLICTITGGPCNASINLDEQPTLLVPQLPGTLESDGTTYTLSFQLTSTIDLLPDLPGAAVATIQSQVVATAPVPAECEADITGDGFIDISDLLSLLAVFQENTSDANDINNDGIVDITDLLSLLSQFDTTCP